MESVFTIGLGHYLALAGMLFVVGLMGVIMNRRNVIVWLMSIELMLLAATLNLVAFSHFGGGIAGQAFAMIVLTVAAAESAIGLAILVVAFRQRGDIAVGGLAELKG
ncbi:MAG: NADH-quinone oxidoreductase subunit NuoK [Bdellovibrionales bacterium]|jgi:NADH-quinone oxidoreductase subunit K